MNAAFLLMTTAWLAGADKPGYHAPPAPAPGACTSGCAPSAPCCPPCIDCCEKESFFSRLRNRMKRSKCDDCCQPVCCPQPCCPQPCAPAPTCCPQPCPPVCCQPCCEKPSFWDRLRDRFRKKDDCCQPCCPQPSCCPQPCAPAPTCCPQPVCCPQPCAPVCCDSCESKGLLNRLRGMFGRKNKDCCEPCCTPCHTPCHGPAPHGLIAPRPGEHLNHPPKKLPDSQDKKNDKGEKTDKGGKTEGGGGDDDDEQGAKKPAEPVGAPTLPASPRPLELGKSPY